MSPKLRELWTEFFKCALTGIASRETAGGDQSVRVKVAARYADVATDLYIHRYGDGEEYGENQAG